MIKFTSQPTGRREGIPVPIEYEAGWAVVWSGRFREEIKPCLAGTGTPDHPAHRLVAMPTTFSGLQSVERILITTHTHTHTHTVSNYPVKIFNR